MRGPPLNRAPAGAKSENSPALALQDAGCTYSWAPRAACRAVSRAPGGGKPAMKPAQSRQGKAPREFGHSVSVQMVDGSASWHIKSFFKKNTFKLE